MRNTLEYKGYIGSVECSEEDFILFGKVQGIRSLISYEGYDVAALVEDFHHSIDEYLQICKEEGRQPEQAFKGSFNVRFRDPELHRRAALYAYQHQMTLNRVVEESVSAFLETVRS